MGSEVFCRRPCRRETGSIGRGYIAAPCKVDAQCFRGDFDRYRLLGHAVNAEKIGEVEFGRRSGLNADRGAVQIFGGFYAEVFGHHESLTVVIIDPGKGKLQVCIAAKCLCCIARQHINLTGP